MTGKGLEELERLAAELDAQAEVHDARGRDSEGETWAAICFGRACELRRTSQILRSLAAPSEEMVEAVAREIEPKAFWTKAQWVEHIAHPDRTFAALLASAKMENAGEARQSARKLARSAIAAIVAKVGEGS